MSVTVVDPQLRLYRPDGTLLCSGQNFGGTLDLSPCTLDASGTYTLLVTDNGDDETGNYSLHLQRTNGPGNATPINFGDILAGTLATGAEADAFTFTGTTGDRLFLRTAASVVDPQLRLYRPDGTLLCSGQNFGGTLDLSSCVVDVSGTHTLLVTENGGEETGNYNLHLQRTNGPGNATPIDFGDILPGTLATGAEADAFTFTGTTGDRLFLRTAASVVDPQLRLYRPDGTLLCSGQNFGGTLDLSSCVVDVSGTYTLLVTENGGEETGNYNLHLQRTNGPGNATLIDFGDILPGTLATGAEADAFTFTGTTGDRLFLRMAASVVDPQLRLYRPDGTLLCSGQNFGGTLDLSSCVVDTSGTYTLLVTENGGEETGNYNFHLQRTNSPGNATPINFGDILAGTLATGAEADAFTFAGTTGDRLFLRMAASVVDPQLRLYRPDGTLLCSSQNFGGTLDLSSCVVDVSGTYTLLVTENGGEETGNYNLHLQRTNGPGNATPINFGDILAGTLATGAEADAFTFTGATGDRLFLRMAASVVDPQLRLYRPDGTLLCSGQNFGGTLDLSSCVVDTSGTYTLLVTDNSGDETGGYNLHLQRTNGAGNATPINFSDTLNGGITTTAELDAYTFSGTAGNQARVTMTRISGSLSPKFRVYRPNGTELCIAETGGTTAQTLCALDTTGTYTILAGDRSGTATGNYALSLQPN